MAKKKNEAKEAVLDKIRTDRDNDHEALARMKEPERRKLRRMKVIRIDRRTVMASSSRRILDEMARNYKPFRPL